MGKSLRTVIVLAAVLAVLLGVTAMGAKSGRPTRCCPTTYPTPVNHP